MSQSSPTSQKAEDTNTRRGRSCNIAAGRKPEPLAPEDDWTRMKDFKEKKESPESDCATYLPVGRNVQRRIKELEEQVATQGKLLVIGNDARNSADSAVTGEASVTTPSLRLKDLMNSRSSHPRDSVSSSKSLENQVDHLVDLTERSDRSIVSHGESTSTGQYSPRRSIEQEEASAMASEMSSWAFNLPQFDDPLDNALNILPQIQDTTSSLLSFHNDENKPPCPIYESLQLANAQPSSEASLAERLEYLVRCTEKLGFENLDSAIAAFYTGKFRDSPTYSTAQQFSRQRALPKLLEMLRIDAETWRQRDSQGYYDGIIKSAESILLAEALRFYVQHVDMTSQDSCFCDDLDSLHDRFQNEVPNLLSLLTMISFDHAQRSGFQYQPRMVTATISLLFAKDVKHVANLAQVL
ncbi:hypothetical protein OPT61_g9607 [Boeremia exigua]|uniref:Uncharacterized protein n=1 Tax=Boeremia exigua TaxID=749465 RepID=A0ACC2HTC6_9PLEO|nr:hypothetical protein OPT61_g9607 [Boeremia exigua]